MMIDIDIDVLRRVLVDLHVSTDDAHHIVVDMQRPPDDRELGPATHRDNYRDARSKIVSQIAYLFRFFGIEPPTPPEAEGTASIH